MPTLARTKTSLPSSVNGLLEHLHDPVGDVGGLDALAAVLEQDRELVAAEPGGGVGRAQARSSAGRRPRSSSWSPAAWPRESLIVLKSSRSMNSTAIGLPSRS